jgi:LPS-assembly lipoprotein
MRALLIALTLGLSGAVSGCGFTPMLAPRDGAVAIGPIYVPEVPGKSGHVFRTELERLLDAERGQGPLRRLEVSLSETVESLALRVDESATRSDLRLNASYVLYDADGAPLISGSVYSVASYDIPPSAYGEVAAQNDARERAAQQLAERMRIELALKLAGKKPT